MLVALEERRAFFLFLYYKSLSGILYDESHVDVFVCVRARREDLDIAQNVDLANVFHTGCSYSTFLLNNVT
jgi:hypothetical protein